MLETIQASLLWDRTLKQFIANDNTLKEKFPKEIFIDTSLAVIAVSEYFNSKDVETFIDSFSRQKKNQQANSALQALVLFLLYKYEKHAIEFAMGFSGKSESAVEDIFFKAKQKLLPMPALEYRTVIEHVCAEGGIDAPTLISYFVNKKTKKEIAPEIVGASKHAIGQTERVSVEESIVPTVFKNPIQPFSIREANNFIKVCIGHVKVFDFDPSDLMTLVSNVVAREFDLNPSDLMFHIKDSHTRTHSTRRVSDPRGMFFAIMKEIKKQISYRVLTAFLTPPFQKKVGHSNVIFAIKTHQNRVDVEKLYASKFLSTLSILTKTFEAFSLEKSHFDEIENEKNLIVLKKKELFNQIIEKSCI